jgi:hypothetical protein
VVQASSIMLATIQIMACMHLGAFCVQGLSIVMRNSEFIRLTLAQMAAAFIEQGLQDVEHQYLLVLFGFQEADFTAMVVIVGFGMLLVQVRHHCCAQDAVLT